MPNNQNQSEDRQYLVDLVEEDETVVSENITQYSWKPYISSILGIVGALGAGATTYLLHNARKVSQAWNLTNALCRATFGLMFEQINPTFRNKVWLEIWKIVCNGSYIITTVDVNKLHTIFSDNYDYGINEFPNLKPFLAFETSAVAGALSGFVGLTRLLCTTEDSTATKVLENIQKPLDFVCPAVAVVGAGLLFDTPGLDSPVLAPSMCVADGVSGVINFGLNQIVKKESFSEIDVPKLNSSDLDVENNNNALTRRASV